MRVKDKFHTSSKQHGLNLELEGQHVHGTPIIRNFRESFLLFQLPFTNLQVK